MTACHRNLYNHIRRLAFRARVRSQERRYERSAKGKLKNTRYRRSSKGRAVIYKANHQPGRKLIARKYNQSAKGKATARRAKKSILGRFHASLRSARLRKINPRFALEIGTIYARAAELRQFFDVVVDHIIPLAKGGAHAPSNLQIIYRLENSQKGARLDFVPSVIFS